MGLRLYQAPVETDCQSKPAADKSAAQARSSIRRNALRRNSDVARELRRRRITAINSYNALVDGDWSFFSSAPPAFGEPAPPTRAENENVANEQGDATSRRSGLAASRSQPIDDRVIAMFGENLARTRRANLAVASRLAQTGSLTPHVEAHVPPYVESNVRTTPAQFRPSPDVLGDHASTNRNISPPETSGRGTAFRARLFRASMQQHRSGHTRSTAAQASLQDSDGLGDRDRSPSPDGDNAWDTLLSGITPDPQPPSLGSSFASTAVSAAASSGGPVASSGTSFSAANHGEDATADAPCESGCDISDTDGEEDDEEEQNALARFPSSLRRYRSYADVTRSTNEDTMEFLGGMQRIVRNLARREDIPDEWWAEAGLSRTLSRETSLNS